MYLLNDNERYKLKSFPEYYLAEVGALISGKGAARIYVDSTEKPSVALLWTEDGSFLIGDTSNETFSATFNDFIDDQLKGDLKSMDVTWMEICSVSQEWSDRMAQLFSHRDCEVTKQYVFRCIDRKKYNEGMTLPKGLELVEISRRLDNGLLVQLKEQSFMEKWHGLDDFCDNSYGVILHNSKEILSWCVAGYFDGYHAVIDIETATEHRKKNYGTLIGNHFIVECLKKGYDPYWDCMEANVASRNLANKLGLVHDHTYDLFSFEL